MIMKMKKYLFLLIIVALWLPQGHAQKYFVSSLATPSAATFIAGQDQNGVISLPGEAGTHVIEVETNQDATVSCDADWCKASMKRNTMTLIVTENDNEDDRSAELVVRSKDFHPLIITIRQEKTGEDKPIIADSGYTVFTNDYTPDPNDTTSAFLDWNHPALEIMRKRAETISKISWTPLGDVPKRNGAFSQGIKVTGIPYSSVKELDKFVGQEVSFYTFLSAVNNPRSVLYTENVGQSPYKGKNCAAYYGSVCSMTVNYALGLDRPYGTFMYGTLPQIKRVAEQDLEHAAPGDIVHFLYGHVIMITDISKNDDGVISYINILECQGNGAFTKKYTAQKFQERLDKYPHVLYRYTNLSKLASEPSPFPEIEANIDLGNNTKALSLSRGDRVTYSEDEGEVVVNVLDDSFDRLVVTREDNGIIVKDVILGDDKDIVLSFLEPGNYKAILKKNDETESDAVYFEILETDVNIAYKSDYIDISFHSSNGIPEYIVFCKEYGGRLLIADITEEERQAGHKLVKCETSVTSLYLKVFFRGEYGRVSNHILPL